MEQKGELEKYSHKYMSKWICDKSANAIYQGKDKLLNKWYWDIVYHKQNLTLTQKPHTLYKKWFQVDHGLTCEM
jgi:hypothetical protein